MSLRRAVRSGLVLLSALGAAAVPLTGSSTTRAPATVPEAHAITAAAPWSFIRRACRTVAAGTVCVNLEGNGQPSTYRVVYQLQPKPGQWMRPLSSATWFVRDRYDGVGGETTYKPFCAGTCAATTVAHNYVVASPYYAVYTFLVQTPAGRVELSAGVTPTVYQSNRYSCDQNALVGGSLSSASDGTVAWSRIGRSLHTYFQYVALGDAVHGHSTRYLYIHYARADHGTSNPPAPQFTTPRFTTGWQRYQQTDGSWTTQTTWSQVDGGYSLDKRDRCVPPGEVQPPPDPFA